MSIFKKVEAKPITLSELRGYELDLDRLQDKLAYHERQANEAAIEIPKLTKKIVILAAQFADKLKQFKAQQ